MTTYRHAEGYTLTLDLAGYDFRRGNDKVRYTFTRPGDTLPLFDNDDFHPSPLHDPEGPESACALLLFLCLRPGDTDREYFTDHNYTPAQMDWAQSTECEYLAPYAETLDDQWEEVK